MKQAGFRQPAARQFFDTFRGTTKEKIARNYGVKGANFIAYK